MAATRAAAPRSSSGRPRPPGQELGAAQASKRALDARGGRGQRDHRRVVERLGPDPAEPHRQRRDDGVAPRGDQQLDAGRDVALDQNRAAAQRQQPSVRVAHLSLGDEVELERAELGLVPKLLVAQLRDHRGAELGEDGRRLVGVARQPPLDHRQAGVAKELLRGMFREPAVSVACSSRPKPAICSQIARLMLVVAQPRGGKGRDLAKPLGIAGLAAEGGGARDPAAKPRDRGDSRVDHARRRCRPEAAPGSVDETTTGTLRALGPGQDPLQDRVPGVLGVPSSSNGSS